MNLFTRYTSAPSRLVNGYLPRKQPAIKPVDPVQPVQPTLDVPSFMKHNRPVEKAQAYTGKQSFASIMAEAERILR